jgi:hypothetical protein
MPSRFIYLQVGIKFSIQIHVEQAGCYLFDNHI